MNDDRRCPECRKPLMIGEYEDGICWLCATRREVEAQGEQDRDEARVRQAIEGWPLPIAAQGKE